MALGYASMTNLLINQSYDSSALFSGGSDRAFMRDETGVALQRGHFAWSGRPKYVYSPSRATWVDVRDMYNPEDPYHASSYNLKNGTGTPLTNMRAFVINEANFMARTYSDLARDSNIIIYTIGLGTVNVPNPTVDKYVLQRLANSRDVLDQNGNSLSGDSTNFNGNATTEGQAYIATDSAGIATIFQQIAGKVKGVITQ
jgi:hypothetical protein